MTYLEFFDTIVGSNLAKRTQVAVVSWALTVPELPANDPTKAAKQVWATEIFQKPKSSAVKILWFAISSIGIPDDGSSLTDAQLQGSVNSLSNSHYDEAVLLPDLSGFFNQL
jgi:hypothetical protein